MLQYKIFVSGIHKLKIIHTDLAFFLVHVWRASFSKKFYILIFPLKYEEGMESPELYMQLTHSLSYFLKSQISHI